MIDQWSFTSPFEGVVNHMYLDSKRFVTCGVGFRVFGRDDVRRFPWASVAAAQADYIVLSTELATLSIEQCRLLTQARLSQDSIRQLFDAEVWTVRSRLQASGWTLQYHPEHVQTAIVDMALNLGVTGLARFVRFIAAIERRDYATAASECSRRGVSQARNEATRLLLSS